MPTDAPHPPPTFEWPPLFLSTIVAAGFSIAERDELAANPWHLAWMIPAWLVLAATLSAVQDVLTRASEQLNPHVANWLVGRIQQATSRAHARYNQWIVHKFGEFDIKGLATQGPFALDLVNVYVDLQLRPQAPHDVAVSPFIPRHPHAATPEGTLSTFLGRNGNLAVIGPPGSGKTTLMRNVALTLARSGGTRTPVVVFLREIVTQACSPNATFTMAEAVEHAVRNAPGGAAGWAARRLRAGKCLLLLDGLDEVADIALRKGLVRWLEGELCRWPGNQFVVSSRPLGYRDNPVQGLDVLEILPFRQSQMSEFVRRWYAANETRAAGRDDEGVRIRAEEGAQDLMRRVTASPDLLKLAVNPLLLTLIANVHRYRSSLPGRRVELYAEICDVFLGRRQEARGLTLDLTPGQKKAVLQPLAWAMMLGNVKQFSAEEACKLIAPALERAKSGLSPIEFLRQAESGSGLVLELEAGSWGFAHKTIQEYLAAVHAREAQREEILSSVVSQQWWHECILLYAALGDSSGVVLHCLHAGTVDALVLGVQCLDDAREIDPAIRTQLLAVVDSGLESSETSRRKLAAECRLGVRLKQLARIDEGVFADRRPLTNAEYQLFVDDELEVGYERAPDHWLGHAVPPERAREPVVGVRGVDALAFCDWLTRRDSGEWKYRLPTDAEVKMMQPEAQVIHLGYWHTKKGGAKLDCKWINDEYESDASTTDVEERLDLDLELASGDDLVYMLEILNDHGIIIELNAPGVERLRELQTWSLRGDYRLGLRVAKRVYATVTSSILWRVSARAAPVISWFFRRLRFCWRFATRPIRPLTSLINWTPAKKLFGKRANKALELLLRAVVFVVKPFWSALWRRLLAKERSSAGETPTVPLVGSLLKDDAPSPKDIVDTVLLLILTTLFELLESRDFALSIGGRQLQELAASETVPGELRTLLACVRDRAWVSASDPAECADAMTWALRVQLLLWLREDLLTPRKGRAESEKKEVGVAMSGVLQCWLDAWLITERVDGIIQPFEGLLLVREHRHS